VKPRIDAFLKVRQSNAICRPIDLSFFTRRNAVINPNRRPSCWTATSVATALILVVVLAMAGSVLIDTLNGASPVTVTA